MFSNLTDFNFSIMSLSFIKKQNVLFVDPCDCEISFCNDSGPKKSY